MAGIWAAVLKRETVSALDNFFELGGFDSGDQDRLPARSLGWPYLQQITEIRRSAFWSM